MCLHVFARVCTCLYVFARVCTCLYVFARVCTCLHVFAHFFLACTAYNYTISMSIANSYQARIAIQIYILSILLLWFTSRLCFALNMTVSC